MADFVGVGFPKCGTSFLTKTLNKHPDISIPQKEIHYFWKLLPEFTEKDYQKYKELFKHKKNLIGEFSPGILYCPNHIYHLHKALPNAKILVIVRNPIDRLLSHIKQVRKGRKNIYKAKTYENSKTKRMILAFLKTSLISIKFKTS